VVRIAGLPEEDSVTLVHTLRPELGPAAASRLARRVGGNPLLLRELAVTGDPSPSLQLTLNARLRRLDAEAREAFWFLALAGRPVAPEVLGARGATSLLDADLALREPSGELSIRHAVIADVALAHLDETEARRLHARIAAAVDDPGEAARHYARAGNNTAGRTKALEAAAGSDRPGERARHLAVAASCADGPEAHALCLQAAWALEDAHDWPALVSVLDQLASAPAEVRAEGELIRARAAWRAGDPDGLREALQVGLSLVDGSGSPVETRLRIERSRIPIFLENDPAAAVRATAQTLELARAAGVDEPRAEYLHGTALYLAERPDAVEILRSAVERARAAGDLSTELVAANNLVAALESQGDQPLARDVAQGFVVRARDLGLAVWERSFRIAVSNLDFHAGRYADVLAAADDLLDLPLEARAREMLLEQLCLALIDLGRIDEALRRLDAEVDRPDDWTLHRQQLWVRCQAALWGGRPKRALELAEALLAGPEGDANIVFAEVSRAWALRDLGRDPVGLSRRSDLRMLAAVPYEVEGISLLQAGRWEAAAESFGRAASLWAGYHRRGELRSLWAQAESARLAAAPDAVDRLLDVESQLQAAGMQPLLASTRRSLRAAGVHRSAPRQSGGSQLLSARQREVLGLVARGLTNDEIAARLGTSRHTVVAQINAASLKLGATSRAHAAALAATSAVPA
jgi:DNA-binding CsgD family transcriptional regulator/tetratricopeptide (TPR) repeat protein